MRSRVHSPPGPSGRDAVEAGQAPAGGVSLVALDVHAELDGLRDERARRGVHDLLDELAEPVEHRARVVRVDGGDAARVARVPGLEELEGRAVAHFADQDAVGPKPHRRHDGVAPRVHARLHEHLQLVFRRTLKLGRVLDDVHAVGRVFGDDLEKRVGERRLARARPAADEDVVVGAHGVGERVALAGRDDPAARRSRSSEKTMRAGFRSAKTGASTMGGMAA